MPRRRPPREVWEQRRHEVWERDGRRCVSPVQPPLCTGKPAIALEVAHIDHIKSGRRAGNEKANLRTLCPTCHCLRADKRHRGMMANALRDEVIPVGWQEFVWE